MKMYVIREKVLCRETNARSRDFSHAPPTVGAPFVAAPSEAPSHESALLFSRLSRWMMTVILDGHRGRVVVTVEGSVVPTSTAGH